jgi:hypothetical protein
MGSKTETYFWGGIVISVIIGWWIQNRKNTELEDQIQSLEESIDESVEVTTSTGW